MGEVYAGRQRVGFLQQSKSSNHWNAKTTGASAFRRMIYDMGSVIPRSNVVVDNQMWASRQSLYPERERHFSDANSQLKRVPFSGVVDIRYLTPHFLSALQAITEGATTPFAKRITSGFIGSNPVIDFASNEGYLYGIAIENFNRSSSINSSFILHNAIIDNLTLRIEANAQGVAKLAKISGEWVGTELEQITGGFTGTWLAPYTDKYINNTETLTFSVNSLAAIKCFKSFSITINNNITSDCISTIPQNYKVNPQITFDIALHYLDSAANDTHILKSIYREQNPIYFGLVNDKASSAADYFKIGTFSTSGYLTQEPQEFDGDYQAIRMTGEIKSYNGTSPLTVDINDSVDWGF
jgi:hypothetical protein